MELILTTINNAVISADIKTAGTGYTAGSNYSSGSNFQIKVNSVDSSGGIASFNILNPGFGSGTSGISVNTNITIAGGGGNAILTVTATGFGICIGDADSARDTAGTTSTLSGDNNNLKG